MKAFLITTLAFLAFTLTCKAQWTTGPGNINNTNTGNVGIGTTTPNANLESQATTEQLRLSFDATHFSSFTTSSAGNLAIQTGIITFNISQYLNIVSNSNSGLILDAATGSGSYARLRTGTTGSVSDFSINAGVGSTNNLRFMDNKTTTTVMTLASNDYVGIGTTSPAAALDILGASAATGFRSLNATALGTTSGGGLLAATPAIPTAAGQRLGLIGFGGIYFGSTYRYPSQIASFSSEAWSSTNAGSYLTFSTSTSGTITATERMRIDNAGNVGIGTLNPDAKLAVQGTIHSTSVLVDTNVPIPDYVFKADYKLPTLAELKAYTDKNHHLPDVPSAAEFEKNGINLGEMNIALLKKVEELTLYLMEQDKKEKESRELIKKQQTALDAQKSDNQASEERIKKLEKQVEALTRKTETNQ